MYIYIYLNGFAKCLLHMQEWSLKIFKECHELYHNNLTSDSTFTFKHIKKWKSDENNVYVLLFEIN